MEAEWKAVSESLGLPSSFTSGKKRIPGNEVRHKVSNKKKKSKPLNDKDDPIDEEDLIKQLNSKPHIPPSQRSTSTSVSMFALQEYYQQYEGKLPPISPLTEEISKKRLLPNGVKLSESTSMGKSKLTDENNDDGGDGNVDDVNGEELNEWGIPSLNGRGQKGKRVLLDGEGQLEMNVLIDSNDEVNDAYMDSDEHPPRRVLLNLSPLPPPSSLTVPPLPIPSRLSSLLPSPSSFASTVPYAKFYHQRRSLFSLFDKGILLDYVGIYSCTPEAIAIQQREMAEQWVMQGRKMRKYNSRQNGDVVGTDESQLSRPITVIDVFGGCGGNAIQFSLSALFYVVAIEYDPIRLACLKHNHSIYTAHYKTKFHNIEYVYGDSVAILKGGRFKGDLVFMSPPWGGVDYAKLQRDRTSSSDCFFDLRKDLSPLPAHELLRLGFIAADHVALCLPKNCKEEEIRGLLDEVEEYDVKQGVTCEYECYIQYNTVKGVLKTLTAYFRRKTIQTVSVASETRPKPKRQRRVVT